MATDSDYDNDSCDERDDDDDKGAQKSKRRLGLTTAATTMRPLDVDAPHVFSRCASDRRVNTLERRANTPRKYGCTRVRSRVRGCRPATPNWRMSFCYFFLAMVGQMRNTRRTCAHFLSARNDGDDYGD